MDSSTTRTKMTVEEIVDALRDKIVVQELAPGVKLREIAVASEFGISRPRVREAFSILEERGLIERTHNQGAVVARQTAGQIEALFDVREVLEALAVRLATQNAPKGTWDVFRERFGPRAIKAIETNDMDYYVEAVNEFRRKTFQEANNEILSQSLDRLYDRTRVLIQRLVLMPGRAAAALEEHRQVIEAMIEGDAVRAEQLKRANIVSARRWFQDFKKFLL
ncbi:GntR family transcriptional regulator [Arvimicrobium flavum]|uniref:GntR family transcriptional regulator n=1 Tax=Arvimicrobium flavum TaxID=3393320 RepID=UPI00237C1463|nr:GntR family transcriptional regulator [Mesorhizobium shangrilense]